MKPKRVPVKEAKDGQLQRLRNRVRKLEKENRKLKSELNALEKAFENTTKFLRDHTQHISLDDLIEAAKKGHSLKTVQDDQEVNLVCPKCLSENFAVVSTPFGEVRSCRDCKYRETVREKK